jgi:hypothetical protein
MVERVMGGPEKTLDFYQLFMIPGMNHCGGGGSRTWNRGRISPEYV